MERKSIAHIRRPEILEAAARCILKRGVGVTRIKDIAAEAGVQTSLIHHYVGKKDEILRGMLRMVMEEDPGIFPRPSLAFPEA